MLYFLFYGNMDKRLISYNISAVQSLLGHTNLQTTMIYTHGATKNILGVRSPLDRQS